MGTDDALGFARVAVSELERGNLRGLKPPQLIVEPKQTTLSSVRGK
jgi:hypothetical protein